MTSPNPGDSVYLGSMMAQLYFWGIVGDGTTPPMVGGSFELVDSDGNVTLDALVGPQGVPGEPADIVKMQYEENLTDPDQLPENLENIELDIGKAYWIGNNVYLWSGTNWFVKQMGTAGPPGPVPHITWSAELVPSGIPGTSLTVPIDVVQSGTALNPGVLIQFDQDSVTGPPGPSGPIRDAYDYDNSVAPTDGQCISWNATDQKWYPSSLDLLAVSVYSVPEANFGAYTGIATGPVNIASFAVPPQPFAWKPLVFGHVYVIGVEISDTPLIVGAEVLLGDPNSGQRIGRGFGNISNYANIIPHFSTPGATTTAVTPGNGTAYVPAYHTGSQGTVYVSLYNDGALGAFQFNPQNAQLLIQVVPVSNFIAPAGS